MKKTEGKILIVDDNEDILFALNLLLQPYMEKIKVTTNPARVEFFMDDFNPDIIILDMNFSRDASSGQEGMEILDKILKKDPQSVVIFITAYADTEKAVKAIRAGAIDYISKPWEKEKLLATISSALQLRKSRSEVVELKEKISSLTSSEQPVEIIGKSPVMLKVLETIDKISGTDANILLLGENGTGKDLIAKAIYQKSIRYGAPFITIDLGAIPETLFESELFGYEKGAFTDARKDKAGRIETASGGTLFLDEIGNLSQAMQSRLLTVLEKRELSRLGSVKSKTIDIRLISATNSNIYQMVEESTFRQDLLYRINTIEIQIPPLRERGEDIILLAEHFLKKYAYKYKKDIRTITNETRNKLIKYDWPGNVRELQHAIERAVILANNNYLHASDFNLRGETPLPNGKNETLDLEIIEKQTIQKALKRTSGNVSKAAVLLGITRFSLYRKMEKFNL